MFLVLTTFSMGCGDDSTTNGGSTTGDTSNTSADAGNDSSDEDTSDGDVEGELDERGFRIRTPGSRTVFCDYPDDGFRENTQVTFRETDHVCTFDNGTSQGFIYLRADPTGCNTQGIGNLPIFETRVFFSIDGTVTEGTGEYDFGGGHNNDEATIQDPDNPARSIRYYHSSFGFGFRACHPMDCTQTYENNTLTEDGCTSDRTVPVVCVRVQDDGSVPALEDTFEKCQGDPTRED